MKTFLITILIYQFLSIYCVEFDDCGATTGTLTTINVSECPDSDDECHFKIGTNATFDAHFSSQTNSNTAIVKVWGIIGGIPVPFPLNPSDACNNWNINCPITNGGNYELKVTIPVLSQYPKIHVDVRVALLDSNNQKLICQQFPVQIES